MATGNRRPSPSDPPESARPCALVARAPSDLDHSWPLQTSVGSEISEVRRSFLGGETGRKDRIIGEALPVQLTGKREPRPFNLS